MNEMTDFQKAFLAKGTGQKLYTEVEVNAQIDGIIKSFEVAAMEYIVKERESCAHLVHLMADEEEEGEVCTALRNAVKAILHRGQKAQPVDNA